LSPEFKAIGRAVVLIVRLIPARSSEMVGRIVFSDQKSRSSMISW
jgi:hypothetical protein